MDQNRLDQLALNFISGIGSYSIKQLVSYCGSAEAVFKTPKSKLLKIPGIGPSTAELIVNQRPFEKAEKELKRADDEGVQILLYSDSAYPKNLKHINDAPALLYYKGTAPLNDRKIVAIVGTRKATTYGKEITEQLVSDLKAHNALIVSGLAYGIDICAHKAALNNNLDTIGVMASGINVVYPSVHREAANKMLSQGGLLTEHSYDVKPDPHKFPARNRIIAGMADAIVIVEAAKKGGALITAEVANGYSRDVFAVPGNLGMSYSEGCNNLIKSNKAHLFTSVKDIEYIMNWEASTDAVNTTLDFSSLDEQEVLVVKQLSDHKEGILMDNLSWQTQLPINLLASILLNLEFKGFVNSLPGKKFKLATR
ncbi:DNA-protecting protein DprA [Fulvivirga sp. RKSG066]|uniref:DNA-processing protein DprA n=1 Tax=Fulvivirga aurantia TaxID=2529383 RepID=UPI0012BCB0CB|nr:DNA-processing protein DprA [Fulvivirga aurantia]MTI20447.1 DNA-protecting protein DprA [Fulvivirga aurantia]